MTTKFFSADRLPSVTIYLGQTLITSSLSLVLIPFLTHHLEPAEFGVYTLSCVYALIAANVAGLGLSQALDRNYFEYEHNHEELASLLYSILSFVCAALTGVFFLIFSFSTILAEVLLKDAGYNQLLTVCVGATFLTSLNGYCLIFFKNEGAAALYAKIGISQAIITVSSTMILIGQLDEAIYAPGYGLLAGNVVALAASLFNLVPRYSLRFSRSQLFSSLMLSLPLVPHTLFGALSSQFDKLLLSMLGSMGGLGVYAVAQRVANVIFQFLTALDRIFVPQVYRSLFSRQRGSVAEFDYLMPFYFLSIGVALFICLFASEVFLLLFDAAYDAAIVLVAILTVFNAMMYFGKIHGTQLVFAKKTHLTSLLVIIGMLVNVGFNVPLILQHGAIGAALGTTLASLAMMVLSHRIAQRVAPIYWDWKAMSPLIICHLLAVVFVVGSQRYDYPFFYEFFGKICILAVYVALGVRLGVLNRKSIRIIFLRGEKTSESA